MIKILHSSAFVADASTHIIKILHSSAFVADASTHTIKILHSSAFVADASTHMIKILHQYICCRCEYSHDKGITPVHLLQMRVLA